MTDVSSNHHPARVARPLNGFVSRTPVAVALLMVTTALVPLTAGCSYRAGGWDDPSKLQVQFYTPPGAHVAIREYRAADERTVPEYPEGHRLERPAVEFAAYNLSPGHTYDFVYTTGEGFPGVNVYGELEVHKPRTDEAKKYMRQALVPVVLPSEYYDRDQEHYYPVRGPSGVGLDALEVEHLRQGDMITKVFFVADLQAAWYTIRMIDEHIARLRSAETVLNAHLEYVDSRFQSYRIESIYSDPVYDTLAAYRDWTGYNKKYIELEAERQRLEGKRYRLREQIDDLQNEKRMRTRLLDTMKIVNRRGTLVLATPETQWPYHDTTDQITYDREYDGFVTGPDEEFKTGNIVIPRMGDILLVMRVGGRHMHWGDVAEYVAEAKEAPADEYHSVTIREEYREEPMGEVVE